MINKILVAIDNSMDSISVFNLAVTLARSTDASLMLLHVFSEEDIDYPILPTYAYYSMLKGNDDGIIQQKFAEYEQRGMEFLQDLSRKAIAKGIDTEYVQLDGAPEQEICELADSWSADLIIVGSRGLKGLKEMFIGSVSNYVTHHAPCSVLIARTEEDPDSISEISVPMDLSENETMEAATPSQ